MSKITSPTPPAPPGTKHPAPPSAERLAPPALRSAPAEGEETVCPRCGESSDLAKVKGCVKCLKCGFKFDCNGW